jgi:o-succinylbenzoate synthase
LLAGAAPIPDSRPASGERSAQNLPPEIEVNAALGALIALQPKPLDRALAAGFRVLKLKLGVAPIARELEAIRALCGQLPPAVRLRLDANRAWDLATARKLLDGLLPVADQIDGLEEPCAEADDGELRALQTRVPFALALDESLPARGWPLEPEQLPLRRLVLKPGVIGGLRPSLRLARRAQAAGLEVVITSLIESAAGLWSSAQLAAATGSALAHGLATADWLAADLGAAPLIQAGRIRLPMSPGSGFVQSEFALVHDTLGTC